MKKINVGIVGCGNISGIYFENLKTKFKNINIYACCDLIKENADKACGKWNVQRILTLDEMLVCDDIEIILNITTPQTHFDICKKILLSGKHVYVEKPLSLSFEEGRELVRLADEKDLLIGCAPDTFLGSGIQTCKKIIDNDFIGKPIGATAFMMCHGHEGWHPSPEFYYKKGGGPMFDMGPYYLTALVTLMGNVKEIFGATNKAFETRTITSEPKCGTIIDVEVPTYVSGILRFENGAICNIITTFDVWKSSLPHIEIYGTKGTLIVPDPNTFGGPVLFATQYSREFKEFPLSFDYEKNSRGIGLSDMADCLINGRKNNKASGKLANHVLEIMCAFDESNNKKAIYEMTTKV